MGEIWDGPSAPGSGYEGEILREKPGGPAGVERGGYLGSGTPGAGFFRSG
jgi:hypothetical protein